MYRHAPPTELACPRCKQVLPPTEIATCTCGGVWLSALAAEVALTERERRENHGTRWWRIREACPLCSEQMTLRSLEPGLFQGCTGHGYFIDADTVKHTNLANNHEYATSILADEEAVAPYRSRLLEAEQARDRAKAEERAEVARNALPPDPILALLDRIAADPDLERARTQALAVALENAPRAIVDAFAVFEVRMRALEADRRALIEALRLLHQRLG